VVSILSAPQIKIKKEGGVFKMTKKQEKKYKRPEWKIRSGKVWRFEELEVSLGDSSLGVPKVTKKIRTKKIKRSLASS